MRNGRAVLHINFNFDKSTLRPDAMPAIDQVTALLKDNPSLGLQIEGHTDEQLLAPPPARKDNDPMADSWRNARALSSAVVGSMGGPTQSAKFASAFANDYAAGNYAGALDNATKAVQASVTQPRTNRGETAVALSLVARWRQDLAYRNSSTSKVASASGSRMVGASGNAQAIMARKAARPKARRPSQRVNSARCARRVWSRRA